MKDYILPYSFNDLFDIVVNIWGCILLLVMIYSLQTSKIQDKNNQTIGSISIPYTNEIQVFYMILLFYNINYAVSVMFDGGNNRLSYVLMTISSFFYYVFGGCLTLLFLYFSQKYIVKKNGNKKLEYIITALQFIQYFLFILLMITPFTGIIYSISEDATYVRGPAYWGWQIFTIVAFSIMLVPFLTYYKKLDKLLKYVFIIVCTVPLLALILDLIFEGYNFNNAFIITGALLVYLKYEDFRAIFAVETLKEMEEVQSKLMMSQIKPHFLYNSLNSIVYYIDENPEKAKEALVNFSKYLRTNLDSVNTKSSIPFTEELEHTKMYISLEKLRFEDKLNIEYDIKDTLFKVPALSIQPIVENAVKHGIRKKDNGTGTVKIQTDESDGYNIIRVIDDGVGFDTEMLDTLDDSHIGIKNVTKRLERECGGSLVFVSDPENGTTCTIKIPIEQGSI